MVDEMNCLNAAHCFDTPAAGVGVAAVAFDDAFVVIVVVVPSTSISVSVAASSFLLSVWSCPCPCPCPCPWVWDIPARTAKLFPNRSISLFTTFSLRFSAPGRLRKLL